MLSANFYSASVYNSVNSEKKWASSIPYGFHPQPETGLVTTLRPYREGKEVTTRAKKRAHAL